MRPGPPQSQEKGNPCLLSDFPRFCSDFIPIFQRFKPNFLPIWPIFRDSFGRGSKWDQPLPTFCVTSTHLDVTSPCILHYVKFLPPSALGAPKYFWFHQFMACIVMRISQPNYEKSVGKGHLFEQAYVKFLPLSTQVV